MKFEKFVEEMEKRVKKALPENTIKIANVRKNNGQEHTALQVHGDGNIAPNIYMMPFYEDFGDNTDAAFAELMHVIKSAMDDMPNVSGFLDFDKVKDNIFYVVVNKDKNIKMLADTPHIMWNDLAIIFRCLVSKKEKGIESFIVSDKLLAQWNISKEKLMEAAQKNTPKLFPWRVTGMYELLTGGSGELMNLENIDFDTDLKMFVATNEIGVEGANVLLYDDLLKAFSKKVGGDFYIFPSSIHEAIFVSENNDDIASYKRMVQEVNSSEVEPEEILSDNVYYYDSKHCKVNVA